MDNERREEIKTMILICLVFFGINYVLFTFIITPKVNSNMEYMQQLEKDELNQSVQEMKELERDGLLLEIEERKSIEPIYDQYVNESVDTILMTVDVYDYIQSFNGLGLTIKFDVTDIKTAVEAQLEEEEAEVIDLSIDDPGSQTTEPIITEVIIDDSEKTYYREVKTTVMMEVGKDELEQFLDELQEISRHYVNIDKVSLNVVNQEEIEEGNTDDATSITEEVDTTTEEVVEDVEETVEVVESVIINEVEDENVQVLRVELGLTSFISDDGSEKSNRELYEFYQQFEPNAGYDQLFELPEEN